MKKALRDKWVKALRSGRYQQGKEYLLRKNADGKDLFCCLGVLCKVAGVKQSFLNESSLDDIGQGGMGDRHGLGRHEAKGSIQRKLATMNDEKGKSFVQIATWIEKNVPITK